VVTVLRRVLVVCVISASLVWLAGCTATRNASTDTTVRIGEAELSSRVQVFRGGELVVSLPGNPTTGYDWVITSPASSQLTTVSDSYESSASAGVVGAGGTRTFVFKATGSGVGTLGLSYMRPWEVGSEPAKNFWVTVSIAMH
jgi:inhibitor of cysteine peptidase